MESAAATEPGGPTGGTPERRKIRRYLLELTVVVGLFVAISAWQSRHLLGTNTVAPAFELASLDGRRVSLGSLRGKRVLLHFWATWCGVCRQEPPALNAVHRGRDNGEVVLAVVADAADSDAVRRFVVEHGIEYPVLLGTPEVVRAFHVNAFPTNYFLGTDGTVRGETVGMSTRWSLGARLWMAGR